MLDRKGTFEGTNATANQPRLDLPYVVGESVQVWSNGKGTWLTATVQAVFPTATIADGYSIPAGSVKVVSEAGIKWIMPENINVLLRKAGSTASASFVPPDRGALQTGSGSSPINGRGRPSLPPDRRPPQPPPSSHPRGSRAPADTCTPCTIGTNLCRQGCGRPVQPGLTRALQPYDTCCKRCAKTRGMGGHDENCGGRNAVASMRTQRSDISDMSAGISLKELLDSLLEDAQALRRHVHAVWTMVVGSNGKLSRDAVANALEEMLKPFGVKQLDLSETDLSGILNKHSSDRRTLCQKEFEALCKEVLHSRQELWFPGVLAVSTRSFVKQSTRGIEEVYQKGRKLGEGTFGIVHLVTHKVSNEKRVCKTIQKTQAESTSDQILQEIRSMAMLDHPNVIKIYEYFDDASSVSQIMELCNGGELQEKIDVLRKTGNRPYDEDFMRDVMKQTLRALAFMHSMRFLHKDLKPQNIMLVDKVSSSIKVIDFGLAELFSPKQEYVTNSGGTLLYMAPEVIQRRLTTKVDVWSAGVILFNLCTGDWPFMAQWPPPKGKDQEWWTQETAQLILTGDMASHPLLQTVSPQCRDVMRQMLTKQESLRPDAARCLEQEWFRGLSEVQPTLSVGVVQCIEAYAWMPELKKAVLLLIAHQHSVDALPELRALFTHFDVRNKGSLSSEDLRLVLIRSGMGPLSAERVIHALDRNCDQNITWTEFTAAAICETVRRRRELADAVFNTLDADSDDRIGMEDFERTLASEETREKWRQTLPKLMEQLFKTEDAVLPRPFTDTLRSIMKMPSFKMKEDTNKLSITKDQFTKFMSQQIVFRAGDALKAVS